VSGDEAIRVLARFVSDSDAICVLARFVCDCDLCPGAVRIQ
jgi:hypothetical protein